jgi:ABC-type sugar transport system ATPase subunit
MTIGPPDQRPFAALRGITRRFGGVTALDDVSVAFSGGEVHAVLGENGSGKSTLVRVLSGALAADAGQVEILGEPRRFGSPREAIAAGVATLYQDMALVPELTAAENVLLGHEPTRLGVVGRPAFLTAKRWLGEVGAAEHARTRVAALSVGVRQMVAMARALSLDARMFIFDEPTAALTALETERLFELIGQLRSRGHAVLYITHRLAEVSRLADVITVLKDGRRVTTVAAGDLDHDGLVEAMVGRKVDLLFPDRAPPGDELVLEARDLESRGGDLVVDRFECRGGEIVGIAGLDGSGRSELARMLAGAEPRAKGSVQAGDSELRSGSVVSALAHGLAFTPADRPRQGIIHTFTVRESVTQSALARFSRFGVLRLSAERGAASQLISTLGVRTASSEAPITSLSGGNQQKTVLARALCAQANVLVCDEPTAGVDVGARAEIYAELASLARGGFGVVVSSSDMTELLGLCHRIVVMREGRVAADLPAAEATEEVLLRAQLP